MRKNLLSFLPGNLRIRSLTRRDRLLLGAFFFFLFWIYLLYGKGALFFEVPSRSMEPTLLPGDKVVAFRVKRIERGDVIAFISPLNPKDILVKRVVGLPGEEIEIHGGKVYINGNPLKEPYIKEPPIYDLPRTRIPPGYYFVLGDNRNNSEDSSVFGPIPRKSIIAKDVFIYWPPSRWGRIK